MKFRSISKVRRSGRTDRKVYAIPVKRKPKPKAESKPKPQPLIIEIPKPEEEPNSLLLLRRNNFDEKTQSYVCPNPSCNKSYTDRHKLYAHFRLIHNKKNTLFCSHQNCNKGFKTRLKLEEHSLTHSHDRPLSCAFEKCFKLQFI